MKLEKNDVLTQFAEQRFAIELVRSPHFYLAISDMTPEESQQAKLIFIGTVCMCIKDYVYNRGIFDPAILAEWRNLFNETNPVQKL